MTAVREIVADALAGVKTTGLPDGLSAIHRPDCAAAIWHRDPPPAFRPWIDALGLDNLPRARAVLRPAAVADAVHNMCDLAGMPDRPERAWLVEDVAALARRFSHTLRAPCVRLRFDAVTTNACRRFHRDAVTARLVCTYKGTGTQFGVSVNGAEPATIFTVPTCAPVVLTGSLWPTQPSPVLLHRSPPIEGTGEVRMVLVLDPAMDLDEEA